VAALSRDITVRHRISIQDGTEMISLSVGEEVTIVRRFRERTLARNSDGQLFNLPSDRLELSDEEEAAAEGNA